MNDSLQLYASKTNYQTRKQEFVATVKFSKTGNSIRTENEKQIAARSGRQHVLLNHFTHFHGQMLRIGVITVSL